MAELGGRELENCHYLIQGSKVFFVDATQGGFLRPTGDLDPRIPYVRCNDDGTALTGIAATEARIDANFRGVLVDVPRFVDQVEQTPAQVADDNASLREYQRSRGYSVPQGVAEAEGLTDQENGWTSGSPSLAECGYNLEPAIQTQIIMVGQSCHDRIASLVLGTQTCALDVDGNQLPL